MSDTPDHRPAGADAQPSRQRAGPGDPAKSTQHATSEQTVRVDGTPPEQSIEQSHGAASAQLSDRDRSSALAKALSEVHGALDPGGQPASQDVDQAAKPVPPPPPESVAPTPAPPSPSQRQAVAGVTNAAAAAIQSDEDPGSTAQPAGAPAHSGDDPTMNNPKTQIVRGPQRPTRTDFHQEPVVGWLVVIGGPGLGAFRPLFTGNNTIGRAPNQRVPIDFGDDSISAQEQAFIRYDATDREFLFVPNLAKTNVVSVNEVKPTAAVKLAPMDVITMGQTQVVFVPFCGEDFDWSELADL